MSYNITISFKELLLATSFYALDTDGKAPDIESFVNIKHAYIK
jgi:hypothetical protein